MPSGAPGPFRRAWYEWKMQRFPWRRKWLVGFDLQGNTFWEFKDALHSLRNRRIAKYSRDTHYGDVKISPSWMQWLRHTRYDPPSLAEQKQDAARQERMKVLAAQADERWASKPSALDAPDKQQPLQMLQSRDPTSGVAPASNNPALMSNDTPSPDREQEESHEMPHHSPAPPTEDGPAVTARKRVKKEPKDSPWGAATQPQDWQPQGWAPPPAKRRA